METNVTDSERYQQYKTAASAAGGACGGRYPLREGAAHLRMVAVQGIKIERGDQDRKAGRQVRLARHVPKVEKLGLTASR